MTINEAHEYLEEIKSRHRQRITGGCKVISLGDACSCTLCLCDKLHGIIKGMDNALILAKAAGDAAMSQLLDVQQDCIKAVKERDAALLQVDVLREFVEAYGHIEGHSPNCACHVCDVWEKAKGAMRTDEKKEGEATEPLYLCRNCGRHHWDGPKDCV